MTSALDRFPVVVGVDGSSASMGAVGWAAALADRIGVPLRIIHAVPEPGYFDSDIAVLEQAPAVERIRSDGEELLTAAISEARTTNPDLNISADLVTQTPAEGLLDAGAMARMLVLGSSGGGTLGGALLGSTALRVATHGSCPAVLWRGDVKAPDRRPVVVGVDGSPESAAALGAAFEFAALFDAPLIAVHAWAARRQPEDVTLPFLIDWDNVARLERTVLVKSIAPFVEQYPQVDVVEVIQQDNPSRLLLQHAKESQLVAVGCRGRGRFAAALLGSTSANVLHNAPGPTMICRATPQTDTYSW